MTANQFFEFKFKDESQRFISVNIIELLTEYGKIVQEEQINACANWINGLEDMQGKTMRQSVRRIIK